MKNICTLLLLLFASICASAKEPAFYAAPTAVSTSLSATAADGDKIFLQWANGNGAKRIVIARKALAVTSVPVNGTNYAASNFFGNGNQLNAGEYVVYNGTATSLSVNGLSAASEYHFAIFEYNGAGTLIEYLLTPARINGSTLSAPTVQSTALTIDNINGHSLKLNWAKPISPAVSGRIIIAREGSAVNVNPVDLATYTANASFGAGSQIGSGNFVVYKNTGTQVVIEDLKPNTTYHFSIFEYSGNTGLVFNTTNPPSTFATTLPRPTMASTAINFIGIEGNTVTLSIAAGNGARRLVIAKKGSAVTAQPQDAVSYSGNTAFGSGQQIATGEFVVSSGTTASIVVTNLEIGATYHFAVFEYDGTGTNAAYLVTPFLANSIPTAAAPTQPAQGLVFTNVTNGGFTVTFQKGDGARRLVVVRRADHAQGFPANLTYYSPATSWQLGSNVGSNNYSVYSNTGNSVTVAGLTGGVTYTVSVFEYNGTSYPVYLISQFPSAPVSTSMAPTNPSTGLNFTLVEGNRMTLSWQVGNGNRRMVIGKAGSPVAAIPVDGQSYNPYPVFGQGDEIATGEFVVFNNANPSVIVSNLQPGVNYHFTVFEYNVVNGTNYYLTSSTLTGSRTTVSRPTIATSDLSFSNISGSALRLNWTNGNGANRIILARAGSPVNAVPADFLGYTFHNVFGLGTQLGTGNFVIYGGSANNATVSGLSPDVDYYFTIYEYNGATAPVYLTPALAGHQKTLARPSVAASDMSFENVEGNKMTVKCTKGNGVKRIIIAKKGSPVAAVPQDGTAYSANGSFGSGSEIATGEFVVYNDIHGEGIVSNLIKASDYYFAVFEYDGAGSDIRYQSVAPLMGFKTTASAPSVQAANVLFSAITGTTASINWTTGNSDRYLVVIRKGSPVNALPADLTFYSGSYQYGTTVLSGDNITVYSNTGTTVSITGLATGTTYHVAVFAYNGFSGPVYNLVNPALGSFTTQGTLPVRLITFNGVARTNGNVLSWKTASEVNSKSFIIERSSDGRVFTSVATVAAAGNSASGRAYSWTDLSVQGLAYYRLRIVDIDGKTEYSPVIKLDADATSGIRLYPTLASDFVTVVVNQNRNASGSWKVYDMSGRIIRNGFAVLIKGVNEIAIDVSKLPAGHYIIEIDNGDSKMTARFIRR